jgi:hypothetical protein
MAMVGMSHWRSGRRRLVMMAMAMAMVVMHGGEG